MADPFLHAKNEALLERAEEVLQDDSLLEAVPPRRTYESPDFPAVASASESSQLSSWSSRKRYLKVVALLLAVFMTLVGMMMLHVL